MRRLLAVIALSLVFTGPAKAGDDELIFVGIMCGAGVLVTGLLAGGLSFWENGAAKDARTAANRYRIEPSNGSARAVASARSRWQEAHEFNNEDDKFFWLVGLTGALGASMCLGSLGAFE